MQEFHYFATHALGFATADTKEEAIEKLIQGQFTDMKKWLTNAQKEGDAGVPFHVCRVPLPSNAAYKIEWYSPKVEGLTEQENLVLTYYTKKTIAYGEDFKDTCNRVSRNSAPTIERWLEETGLDRTDLMQQLAIDIQHAISTPELASLIEECQALYEPLCPES